MTDERDTAAGREDQGRHAAPWGTAPSRPPAPIALRPADVGQADVLDLIKRAEESDHGPGFLVEGSQDAVAATFGVHAFVVDAARDHLSDGPVGGDA